MTSLAISGTAIPSSRNGWITPKEQLERLALSMLKDRLYANKDKMIGLVPYIAMSCATRSILRRSHLEPNNGVPILTEVPPLMDLAAEQFLADPQTGPLRLPPILSDWYIARKKLGILPEEIPPLPQNIYQIVCGKCPIYDEKRKSDGTHYTVGDTHTLQLLCEEDGNLNQFEEKIMQYGEKNYPKGRNPLQIRFFVTPARKKYGDLPFAPTHWELLTRDILPDSKNKSYETQVGMIRILNKKACVNYGPPSLEDAPRTIFLHKVATGEGLYTSGNWTNSHLTYTSLEEVMEHRLQLGSFDRHEGGQVGYVHSSGFSDVGIAAQRKFRPLNAHVSPPPSSEDEKSG